MVRRTPRQFIRDLFNEQSGDLERFLRTRVSNKEDARDLAQEAFMRLLRLERTEFIRRPEQYLLRIAANLAYEHRLKDGKSVVDAVAEVPEAIGSPGAEQLLALRESLEQVNRAMEAMSPNVQAALVWQRRDGLTYAEIADRLGVSTHMVKKYLQKGVAILLAAQDESNDES